MPRALRLILLLLLVLIIAGLGYLGFSEPAYRPQQVSQPVQLPDAARP